MTATPTQARLTDAEKYELILACDARWDGRFYVGVVTTGIYCRPSCRVRKPLRKNVRFFTTTNEARQAGLRPCRRCHPDDFANGEDPDRDELLALLAEVQTDPAHFDSVEALVERSGYGATRLFDMFRRVLRITPASVLNTARIEHAKRMLRESEDSVLEVALASGFHSASAFHRHFRLATGLTPLQYRIHTKETS
jgi:AraC family transcriptional regulator of adaptative response / DNA-3-methyladenine glycosylase II